MSPQFVSDNVKAALFTESAALVNAAKRGASQTDALKAFIDALNARGVYLAELTSAGHVKLDLNLAMKAEASAVAFDPEAPYSVSKAMKSPLGCGAQVSRASKIGTNLDALASREKEVPVPETFLGYPVSHSGPACQCRIAENGCIDPSLCSVEHSLAPIPLIPRWNFATAAVITGGCNQLAWSGWAHPSVMSLLGRFPTCGEVKRLIARTHPRNLHVDEHVLLQKSKVYDDGTTLYHFMHLTAENRKMPGSLRISQALKAIADSDRIGGSIPEEVAQTSKSFPVPKSFKNTPAIEALGGLSAVPTFLCALQKAPAFDATWGPDTFPSDMTDISTEWRVNPNGTDLSVHRRSEFVYHHPEELQNPLLGQRFSDELRSRWAYLKPAEDADVRRATVPVNFTRAFRAVPPVRVAIPDFSPVTDYLNGSLDYETLRAADNAASFSRALGSRANRLQQGWESELVARWMRVRTHARSGAQTRQYFEFAYRLISRYIGAMAVSDANASVPVCTGVVANSATNIQITFINAATPLPAPGSPGAPPAPVNNGEQPYWDSNAQSALMTGSAQFFDVEGLSREEIAQTLAAVVPTTHVNIPFMRRTIHNPAHNADQNEDWSIHAWRNTYPNGVAQVFLHLGNNPLPDAADQAWIQANANCVPDPSIISTLIRHFGMRHDISPFLEDALQTALYRTVGYTFEDALGHDVAKRTGDILDADGNTKLYLPRNNTRWGYFDVFYQPVALSPLVERFLSYAPREIVNIGSLLPHFKSVSINWASKALTMLGSEWSRPAAGGNQYLRNHWDKLVRHFYHSTVTLWSTIHANALAFQYGFTQPPICRATENGTVMDWWLSFQAPYLANHYLELWGAKTLPMFQVLPYYDPDSHTSRVQWPADTPRPTQNWLAFDQSRSVKVAREFDPIPGFSWLGDGGAEHNLQFYVAQGNDGQWAKDGGVHKEQLMWWPGERIDQPPTAPNPVPAAQTQYMGTLNTPWADFLLPGSVRSFDTTNLRIRNWAVRQRTATPLTGRESHRWWEAANELPHRSLMVNYIHPFRERRQIDAIADYSVVFWEQDNMFAGLTFSNLFQEISKGDARFDTIRPQQSMFELHAVARPREFEFYNPTRVSANRPRIASGLGSQRGEQRVAAPQSFQRVDGDVVSRIADLATGNRQRGKITYDTRYPHVQSELEDMEEGVVEYDHEAISHIPEALPDPETLAKLARIENHAAETDQAFKEFLAQQRARVMAAAPTSSPRLVPAYRPSTRPASSQGPRRSLAPMSNPRNLSPRIDEGVSKFEPRKKVSFNDNAASSAQHQALSLGEIIEKSEKRFSPAQFVAGSRRPGQPNSRHADDTRYTTEKEDAAHADEEVVDRPPDAPQHEQNALQPPVHPFNNSHISHDGSITLAASENIARMMGDDPEAGKIREMSLTTPKN